MTKLDVWFSPKDDITVKELCEILRMTVFMSPGSSDGIYSILPPQLKRHFELREQEIDP